MGELIGEVVENRLYFVERPEFDRIRSLPIPREDVAELFADLARLNTLYMIARAGSGHIGSSFSSMEIVSWIHLFENGGEPRPNIYFSSKGHDAPGLYAVLTALGRQDFDLIHRFRRLDGLPGHPDRLIAGMVTNTGSLGMGISKAKGMHAAFSRAGSPARLFVMLGDGELQEGQVWESLVSAANAGTSEIVAIVDHNKLQSDTFVEDTSDLGDLDAKFAAFGWQVERIDGHDCAAIGKALAAAGSTGRPTVVIADTIKGRGVSFMESTAMESDAELYRFHSGAPDASSYSRGVQELLDRVNRKLGDLGVALLSVAVVDPPARAAPAATDQPVRLVPIYSKLLLEAARQDERIIALDADLALDTGLLPLKAERPAQFVECGIAEMDMVSQAGGMALNGLMPIAHSFACFLSTRANEQIYNNCTERTKVGYFGALAGILPAAPGHSHQSVRDISAIGGCPNLILVEPANEADLTWLFRLLVDASATPESVYIRLSSIPYAQPYALPRAPDYAIGRGYALRDGKHGTLFTYGPVFCAEAFKAAERLEVEHGIAMRVVNMPFLNRIDRDWLGALISDTPAIVTLDNHYLAGGLGEKLLAAALGCGWSGKVLQLGLTDIPPCGAPGEVLERLGLDAASIAQRLVSVLGR